MLTYDSLIEQAKKRGMPVTKVRGILREYLQVLILKELYKTQAGKKFYFTGGTYLRLTNSLKRFSEDLDFNIEKITGAEFENLVNKIKIELKRSNIYFHPKFKYRGNIYSADLIFPEVEKIYNVISAYSKKEGIIIKFETNRPKWKIKKSIEVISGFGELYPCICTDKSAFFADKIDALDKKTRARHIYDVMFMLSNLYPIDKNILSGFGIKGDPLDAIKNRIMGFSVSELKKQAETLRPFLFEENDADLIINAQIIIPSLLEKYRQSIKS